MDRRRPRTRILLLAGVVVLGLGAVLGRLFELQILQYRDYLARARRQQQRIVEVSPGRGLLLDRNFQELARSVPEDSWFAIPAEISDPHLVAQLLAPILKMEQEEIVTRLTASKTFVWLARKLPPEKSARIQALGLRGIYSQKESQRFYPKGALAAHVLGYVDVDGRGLGGLEYQFDDRLRGKPVEMLVLADARRRWYERHGPGLAADASNLVLSLDENIQYIAEKSLSAAIARTHARAGAVLVQDPNTGELLALANWPSFNPNTAGAALAEARMDRAVSAIYEPGSTFKIVTLAGALQEHLARPDELVDCQMGSIVIANHRIHDHKPFGLLSVTQILAQSSDVGAIKLGLRLGAPKFYDYIRAFGFGQQTGIELPGESRGLLRRLENWSAISIGGVSMGQEIGVTPVQLISAVSAIANGGTLYPARVLRAICRGGETLPAPGGAHFQQASFNPAGEPSPPGGAGNCPAIGSAGAEGRPQEASASAPDERHPASPAPRRAVSPETAAILRHMMEQVVLSGTGKLARLEGYTVGGKTGTAQKIDPSTGRYSARNYIASFVGFAPLNSPALTVLVILDSPEGGHHGGDVAAPVFREVMQQALSYLHVPPDIPVESPALEAARRRAESATADDLSDFDSAQLLDPDVQRTDETLAPPHDSPGISLQPGTVPSGRNSQVVHGPASDSDRVRTVAPQPRAPAPAAGFKALSAAETTEVLDESSGVGVPDFTGRTVRAFVEECMRLGLSPAPVGAGVAAEQSPPAGTHVRPGSRIVVRFAASLGTHAISDNSH